MIAALHIQGGAARLVIADLSSSTPSLRETHSFGAADTAAIATALESAKVGRLIRVLSSASTIVRTPALPEGLSIQGSTDTQIAGALALLSESELPSTIPEFRRVAGLLQLAPAGPPIPLLASWTGPVPTEWARTPWPCPEVWTPEVAALAAFARSAGATESAACIDRTTAAGAIVASGPKRSLARVLKLADPIEPGAARAIAESRAAAGLPPPEPTSLADEYQVLLHPVRPAVRVLGKSLSPREVNEFAVAIGAILLAADPSPNVQSLVGLHEREPRGRGSILERGVRALGTPLRAGITLAACVAVLLAIPIAVAYANYAVLQQRTKADTNLDQRIRTGERDLAFAKLVRDKRWPMTKLVADVAGAAPVGITFESLELTQETGTITLRGVADSSNLVTTLRENLAKTKIFTQVNTPSIGAASDPAAKLQFQLTAKVPSGAATYDAPPIDDFAARPLVARLYGDGAVQRSRSDRPSRADKPDRSERAERSSRSSSGSTSRAERNAPASTSSSSSASKTHSGKAPEIPAALSDDQISKLTRAQAMIEWAKRKSAATQQGISDSDKTRLQEESEKAKRRMDELKQQSSQSSEAPSPAHFHKGRA